MKPLRVPLPVTNCDVFVILKRRWDKFVEMDARTRGKFEEREKEFHHAHVQIQEENLRALWLA